MSPYIACFLLNNHPSLILCLASSLSSSASSEQASEITDPVAMKNSNPICSHYTFFLPSLLSWHSGASFLQIYCSSSCTEDTPWSRHSDNRNLNFLKVTLKACIPSLFLSNTSSIFVQRRYLLWELKIFAAQLSSGVDLNCLNPFFFTTVAIIVPLLPCFLPSFTLFSSAPLEGKEDKGISLSLLELQLLLLCVSFHPGLSPPPIPFSSFSPSIFFLEGQVLTFHCLLATASSSLSNRIAGCRPHWAEGKRRMKQLMEQNTHPRDPRDRDWGHTSWGRGTAESDRQGVAGELGDTHEQKKIRQIGTHSHTHNTTHTEKMGGNRLGIIKRW